MERGTFEETCRPVVMYLHMNALRVGCLPPPANVPARGGKMAMRPFAKLFWTVVYNEFACSYDA